MSQFNLQWSLDKSADNVIAFLTECIRVATMDDVQPSAILASEKFGATLAISPVSRTKIERIIDSQSEGLVIRFLKCKVGYASNGAIDLLRRSMAGVNILALIAALLGSTDNFNVAMAIELMMEKTLPQENGTVPLPTAYQLNRLIEALEPKLVRVKFAEDVIYWKNWYTRNPLVPDYVRKELLDESTSFPESETIHHIVDALRRLSRIGDAEKVEIQASASAPWITAFIVWSLGIPPKVIIPYGKTILDGESPATLVLSNRSDGSEEIEVKIFRAQDSFAEILISTAPHVTELPRAVGMVSMAVRSRELLEQLRFERGSEKTESLGYRAMADALPKALYQVRNLCWLESTQNPNCIINPFPSLRRIGNTAKQYLGLQEEIQLHKPATGSCIADLPLARSWVLEQDCGPANSPGSLDPNTLFPTRLAPLVTDILALSLFDECLDDIMLWSDVWGPTSVPSSQNNLLEVVLEILLTGKPRPCSVEVILEWALGLVRHEVSAKLYSSSWLGSSFKGQVVFPRIFENKRLPEEGWLRLYCLPGVLMSNDKRKKAHRYASPSKSRHTVRSELDIDEEEVTRVENFFNSDSIIWNIEDYEEGIGVAMGWSGGEDLLDTFHVLTAIQRTVLVKKCPHEQQCLSPRKEDDVYFQGPADDELRATEDDKRGKITVFPISGNAQLRLLALSSIAWRILGSDRRNPLALVNEGSCMACALHECRKLGCQYLIL